MLARSRDDLLGAEIMNRMFHSTSRSNTFCNLYGGLTHS